MWTTYVVRDRFVYSLKGGMFNWGAVVRLPWISLCGNYRVGGKAYFAKTLPEESSMTKWKQPVF